MPESLNLATTDPSGGHRELRKSLIWDLPRLGYAAVGGGADGLSLAFKTLLLVDSDQPDEREGALDAVKFGSHVVEAVMTRNHGQKSWAGVLEEGVGGLAGSEISPLSAGIWGELGATGR